MPVEVAQKLVHTLQDWWAAKPQQQGRDKATFGDLATRVQGGSSTLLLNEREARCLWARSGK